MQIPALQVAAAQKSFQEVVEFVIEVEGVKPDNFTMASTSKVFQTGGEFSGSYSRGKSSGGYPARPIQSSLQALAGGPSQTSQPFSEFGGYPRLCHSHRNLCLTPEIVMDVERMDILGNIVQNRVIDLGS